MFRSPVYYMWVYWLEYQIWDVVTKLHYPLELHWWTYFLLLYLNLLIKSIPCQIPVLWVPLYRSAKLNHWRNPWKKTYTFYKFQVISCLFQNLNYNDLKWWVEWMFFWERTKISFIHHVVFILHTSVGFTGVTKLLIGPNIVHLLNFVKLSQLNIFTTYEPNYWIVQVQFTFLSETIFQCLQWCWDNVEMNFNRGNFCRP